MDECFLLLVRFVWLIFLLFCSFFFLSSKYVKVEIKIGCYECKKLLVNRCNTLKCVQTSLDYSFLVSKGKGLKRFYQHKKTCE